MLYFIASYRFLVYSFEGPQSGLTLIHWEKKRPRRQRKAGKCEVMCGNTKQMESSITKNTDQAASASPQNLGLDRPLIEPIQAGIPLGPLPHLVSV